MNPMFCSDSIPSFLGFFDISIAPHLLFYTYIPTIVISLFLGFFVYYKDNKSLLSKLLFGICAFFTLWVLDILILWIAAYNDAVMFGWQITPILEIPIFIFAIYFTHVITSKDREDISPKLKLILIAIMFAVFTALPSYFNITHYNTTNCEGIPGHFWDYMYIGELFVIAWIAGICIGRYRKVPKTNSFRKQIIYVGIGIVSFTMLFVGSNIAGQITGIQEISFIGSLGMVIFLAFLAYLIVRYRTFNIKLIATQALTFVSGALIASQFFFIQNPINHVLNSITLLIFIIVGIFLVRSVKREVEQREEIEKLASKLQDANQHLEDLNAQKTQFISLATHQIRAPLAAIKGYGSLIMEGDYGPVSDEIKEAVQTMYLSAHSLVGVVGDYLDISRLELGKMKYDLAKVELRSVIDQIVKELQPNLSGKELQLVLDKNITNDSFDAILDLGKAKQIIGNLIDNAIKYTERGTITVGIEKTSAGKIKIAIKDTGVGISPETMPKLFKRFSRADDAQNVNTLGTGLGLFIVKQMTEAQNGKVWAESEGKGKGSQFYIEFPTDNKPGSVTQEAIGE